MPTMRADNRMCTASDQTRWGGGGGGRGGERGARCRPTTHLSHLQECTKPDRINGRGGGGGVKGCVCVCVSRSEMERERAEERWRERERDCHRVNSQIVTHERRLGHRDHILGRRDKR